VALNIARKGVGVPKKKQSLLSRGGKRVVPSKGGKRRGSTILEVLYFMGGGRRCFFLSCPVLRGNKLDHNNNLLLRKREYM